MRSADSLLGGFAQRSNAGGPVKFWGMTHDWLLVETLGSEPAVVAQGRQPRNLVPIAAFLRRSPHLAAIRTAIAESVQTAQSLASITPKSNRVIRTEPVMMSDGRIHGVHVWSVLALAIKAEPGQTVCSSWDVTDWHGTPIRTAFVARNTLEPGPDGRDHFLSRGMNWSADIEPAEPGDLLAQRILHGLAQPGVHRALVNLSNWRLLKWLDDPCPYYDWRGSDAGRPPVHPDDAARMTAMTAEFVGRATARVLRLPGYDGAWVPLHATLTRVELEKNVFVGLISLRCPSPDELVAIGLPVTDDCPRTLDTVDR